MFLSPTSDYTYPRSSIGTLTSLLNTDIFILMKGIKKGDLVIALLAVVLIVAIGWNTWRAGSGTPALHIQVDERTWIYMLDKDQTIEIQGPIGLTRIIIEDEHVHVSDSPCTEKICIAAGEISESGDWIVCLPNRVFLSIEGTTETQKEVDDVVY